MQNKEKNLLLKQWPFVSNTPLARSGMYSRASNLRLSFPYSDTRPTRRTGALLCVSEHQSETIQCTKFHKDI